MSDKTGSGHSIGMPDRYTSAVDVVDLGVDPETVATIERLARKRFVEFPQTDIIDLQIMALEQFWNGEDRPDTHLLGRAAGDRDAPVKASG